MSADIIMITSCKGGVGKSTISANLALFLANEGHRTLLIDCDFGNRSLDLFLGLQNRVVYDLSDIILRAIPPEWAVIPDAGNENLMFCAAPYDLEEELITPEAFSDAIDRLIARFLPEYVLIDTPGNIGHSFKLVAGVATEAFVVSTCQPVAIRAAGRTGAVLQDYGIEYRRLIINGFDPGHYASAPDSSPLAIIDETCLRLLSIIPFDSAVMKLQAEGRPICEMKHSNVPIAYRNLISRMMGNNVPLFTGFRRLRRSRLMNCL